MYRWLIIAVFLGCGCGWLEDEPAVTYTVVRGDTLTKISKAYGVSVADLQKWNGLSGDQIEVGQVLAIESGGESTPSVRLKPRKPGKTVRKTTSSRKMPKPKPCLKGPSLDDLDVDDVDIQGSRGLSVEQIRAPMKAFLPTLGECFPGSWPSAVVDLEITVACTGLVANVRVIDGGGLESAVLTCMSSGLNRVAFPAHDVPGGFSFRYPVNVSP